MLKRFLGQAIHYSARGVICAGIAEKQNPEVNWADIDPSVQGRLPYYPYLSAAEQKVFDAWPGIVQWYADTTAKFERPNAGKPTPYLRPDAPHYFYISDEAWFG
jgi:hypothetical protein